MQRKMSGLLTMSLNVFHLGLHDGVAGKPSTFTINTRDAGYGGLGLSIEGPSKAQITCTDNEDGTCTVEYLPVEPGKYTINVKFADEDVPGSPFTSNVRPSGDAPIQPIEENLVRRNELELLNPCDVFVSSSKIRG